MLDEWKRGGVGAKAAVGKGGSPDCRLDARMEGHGGDMWCEWRVWCDDDTSRWGEGGRGYG